MSRNNEESARDVAELSHMFERLNISVESFVELINKSKDAQKASKEEFEALARGMSKSHAQRMREQSDESDSTTKKTKKAFSLIRKDYKQLIEDLKDKGGILGAMAVGGGAIDSVTGISAGLKTMKGSILGQLPFGGLIGLMMYGAGTEESVRAAGVQTMRMFQQSGETGKNVLRSVNAEARDLGIRFGKGPTGMFGEFQAAAAQFAQAGIDVEDVVKGKFKSPIEGVGESALKTSIRLDSLFKSGAGTNARVMASMMRDFNLDSTESAKIVAGIGLAARDSGTSVQAFTTSVMRSSASMRTMRVDIGEVANAQLKFAEIIQKQMPGATPQFAAGYAEKAAQQITQAMSGMGVGMSAVLAERMSDRGAMGSGENVSGLKAYYAFKEGFGGAGQKEGEKGIFVETINEMIKMAKETGGTAEEQRYFLEAGPAKMGFEGSKVMMAISKSMDEGNTIQQAVTDHQKDLNKALRGREGETDLFRKSLLKVQDGIAVLGAGLLGTVIAGFKMLALLIGGGSDKEIAAASKQADASLAYIVKGLKKIPEGISDGLKPILGVGSGFGGGTLRAPSGKRMLEKMLGGAGDDGEEDTRSKAAQRLRDETSKQLKLSLISSNGGLNEDTAKKLVDLYKSEERLTGKGEKSVETELKKLDSYKGRTDIASRIEKGVAKDFDIVSPTGEKMKLELVVGIKVAGGFSGQAEPG